MRSIIFPIAFMVNTFAMMTVMIGLSLFGKPELAADFGLIHGATVALFYSLSGNARSLILGNTDTGISTQILKLRLILILPLSIGAVLLCIGIVDDGLILIIPLVFRRATEWIAEVSLSNHEVSRNFKPTFRYVMVQSGFVLIVLFGLINNEQYSLPILWAWSLSPLLYCDTFNLLKGAISAKNLSMVLLHRLLPHFGSTLVIGISVYSFRLILFLMVGKEVSGDLFAAFSIGGLLGAAFSQALGPSIILNETVNGRSIKLNKLFNLVTTLVAAIGISLFLMIYSSPSVLDWTSKSNLFWLAVSASLTGSALMIYAQKIRLRIIQNGNADVFGSDLLANMLLISAIPFMYYWIGIESLTLLYLIGAFLSLLFYSSEEHGWGNLILKPSNQTFLYLVALGIFTPIFFQLANGLFQSDNYNYSSVGKLVLLPIPLSAIVCYGALILFGKFTEVRESLLVLFFTIITMIFTTITLSLMEANYQQSKFILLIQFILPMFALVVGQQFGSKPEAMNVLGTVFFYILAAIAPFELLSTIITGSEVLSPSVFIFSIYQHLQYVPVIFVSMFLFVIFMSDQIPKIRRFTPVLAIFVGAYAGLSASLLAISLLVTFSLGYILYKYIRNDNCLFAITTFLMIISGLVIFLAYTSDPELIRGKFIAPNASVTQDAGIPVNLTARVVYWQFYFSGVFSNIWTFLLGHLEAPDRNLYPSAHNYYLDFIYNFGALALLPLTGLIIYTAFKTIQRVHYIWKRPELICLAAIVFFLLLIDNSLKVGLRQPYPGIVSFFIWGVLLAFITDKTLTTSILSTAEKNLQLVKKIN